MNFKNNSDHFYSYYKYDPLLTQWIKIPETDFNNFVVKFRDQFIMFYVQPNLAIYLLNGFPAYMSVYLDI